MVDLMQLILDEIIEAEDKIGRQIYLDQVIQIYHECPGETIKLQRTRDYIWFGDENWETRNWKTENKGRGIYQDEELGILY